MITPVTLAAFILGCSLDSLHTARPLKAFVSGSSSVGSATLHAKQSRQRLKVLDSIPLGANQVRYVVNWTAEGRSKDTRYDLIFGKGQRGDHARKFRNVRPVRRTDGTLSHNLTIDAELLDYEFGNTIQLIQRNKRGKGGRTSQKYFLYPAPPPAPNRSSAFKVYPVYFIGSDETGLIDPIYSEKLKTAFELIDEFYVRELSKHGHAGRSLQFVRDATGRPAITLVVGNRKASEYKAIGQDVWATILEELEAKGIYASKDRLVAVVSRFGPWVGLGGIMGENFDKGGFGFVGDIVPLMSTARADLITTLCDRTVISIDGAQDNERGVIAGTWLGGLAHELGHAMASSHTHSYTEIMGLGNYNFVYAFTQHCRPESAPNAAHIGPDLAKLFAANPFLNSALLPADDDFPELVLKAPKTVSQSGPITFEYVVSDKTTQPTLLWYNYRGVTRQFIDLRNHGSIVSGKITLQIPSDEPIVPGQNEQMDISVIDQAFNHNIRNQSFIVRVGK